MAKELTTDEKFGLILESIGKIEKSVEDIKEDISEIKKVQLNQEEVLKRQNQIIELLASRSIYHESDLKRLNQIKKRG